MQELCPVSLTGHVKRQSNLYLENTRNECLKYTNFKKYKQNNENILDMQIWQNVNII